MNRKDKKIDLLLDGGRAFFKPGLSKTPSSLKRAKKIFSYYKKMNYDGCALSSDELLIAGIDFFKRLQKEYNLIISLNITANESPIFIPYKIKDIKGIKIAIVGLSNGLFKKGRFKKNITIEDPVISFKKYLNEIRENSQLIIVLSSLNKQETRLLISQFPEISLVISSGIGMPTYVPLRFGKTLIVASHPKGKAIGMLKIELDKNGNIKDYNNTLIMLKESPLIEENF